MDQIGEQIVSNVESYFFEQGYLHFYCKYHSEIVYVTSSYPFWGKLVSDSYLGPSFYFMQSWKKSF